MDCRDVGGIASDGGNIVGTECACSVGLRDLLGNEMAKHRELVAEILVDSDKAVRTSTL